MPTGENARTASRWTTKEDNILTPWMDKRMKDDDYELLVQELKDWGFTRTVFAVRARLSVLRESARKTRLKEIQEEKSKQNLSAIATKVPPPVLDGVEEMEVTPEQKQLFDKIATIVHYLNGKYYKLKVV